ncbi:TonB-dependent receptor domain-containing protein [Hypericibacter sp.]|uniref:TonB-dependent receptor domain-containing protein n=1 Tax=Hypericibacter sp. TaxID=2705401 RepID=UPI003D6CE5AB
MATLFRRVTTYSVFLALPIALWLIGGSAGAQETQTQIQTQSQSQTSDQTGTEATEDGTTPTNTETPPPPATSPVTRMSVPPVTVTATRNAMEAFEYPGSVTVIDQEKIQTRIPSTVDDVMVGVPNVTFAGGPRRNGESPIIRGFTAQDVIILLDGTRQDLITGHDSRFFLDPALLKSVEVVRGASSALYGSGGLGGVIELRTKDASDFLEPGETFGMNGFIGGQSVDDQVSPGVTMFGKVGDNLDLIGSFVFRDSDNIDLGDDEELDADDQILSGLAKAKYTMGPNSFEGAWLRYDGSATEPGNPQSTTDDGLQDKDIITQTWRGTYNFHEPGNQWIDLDATVYYTQNNIHEKRIDDLGPGPEGEELKRDLDTVGMRVDNRTRFNLGTDSNVVFTYGVEAYRDNQNGDDDGEDLAGVPDAYSNLAGVFTQAEFTVPAPFGMPGDFLIIPGVRFDYYASDSDLANDNVDTAVSPKIATSYMPTDWLMFYGSYGYAFSAPNINDLYLTGVHFEIPLGPPFPTIVNRFQPNPDLKSQTTQTVEAGMGLDFEDVLMADDRATAKGGWFLTYGDDLISRNVVQPSPFVDCNPFIAGDCDGTTIIDNVNKARLDGVELEAQYENDYMIFGAAYSHIDGENTETGEPLGDLQPDTVTFHTAAKIQMLDMQIGSYVTWAQDFDNTDDPTLERDGYVVTDIYAVWAPQQEILRGFTLAAGIDNLFDETYTRVFTGSNEAGRNYKAMMSYQIAW